MNKLIKNLKTYSYIYFLGLASAYSIFFSVYSLNDTLYNALFSYDRIIAYFKDVSILFFTAGIFTVSLKYLQFLGVFEKEFNKAIASDAFDKKLEKQLKQITFSEEFLIEQSNLPELWETVTLCKYRQQFPELYPKLKKKIDNELFLSDNISYYYKNFQINYEIKLLDDNYVEILERASLTIVRPNEDEFDWDFGVTFDDTKDENIKYDLSFEVKNVESIKFNKNDIKERTKPGLINKYVTKKLKGHLEYHIERNISLVQDLRIDRQFSFGSERIIDDISLRIKHCDNLSIFFTTVNKNKMYHNGAFKDDELAYINRDIFLSGEKFKIFIYKN
jgi:hypothetical protein